jgi:predicted lipoprotein with Yx(FWY)xxD motif
MNTKSPLFALGVTMLALIGGSVFVRSVPAAPAGSVAKASVAVGKSRYGQILFDGRGFALYAFTHDTRNKASCYGECATKWPPYIVGGKPAAGRGAVARLLGTTRRADGKLQATYGGRPLYYYDGDTAPGIVFCQDVDEYGGTWLVLRGSGKLVHS